MASRPLLFLVAVAALGLAGCGALALPAVGSAALSGGARGLVKAGTEYSFAGAAYRTFSLPVKDVYEAVHETFQVLEITTAKESFETGQVDIHGVAIDRTLSIKLDPITPTLTRMKLVVHQHGI